MDFDLTVIGGGLAGCEAAWQAAERGLRVRMVEMRPTLSTGAHSTADLAELICSNSLGSDLLNRASGLLKEELRRLNSLLIRAADSSKIPAGTALAVDRELFSQIVSQALTSHPNIQIELTEITDIPTTPTIVASGPLTSDSLAKSIQRFTGQDNLFFYDALAPIVTRESIDMDIAYRASRFAKNDDTDGDYINCPFSTKESYESFITELVNAERIPLKEIENNIDQGVPTSKTAYFEGCLPIEVLARRDVSALAFGPLRPIGLRNPHTGNRPYAVVQLRQDNRIDTLYNLVGFQTNLKYSEQKRVFQMIPGLEHAEFTRYGQMHRNTYIASPNLLAPSLQSQKRPDLFFAGQITGVEGYVGNIATGLLAGINMAFFLQGRKPVEMPITTMLGALCDYITHAELEDFQPMKANFNLLPPLGYIQKSKMARYSDYSSRALNSLEQIKELL